MTLIPINSEGDMELAIKETIHIARHRGKAIVDLAFTTEFLAQVFLWNLNSAIAQTGVSRNKDVELNIIIVGDGDAAEEIHE